MITTEYDPTVTDEEHLLRALDADPGDRAALMALSDLLRERGEDDAADWLAWALENKRNPRFGGDRDAWFHAAESSRGGRPDVIPWRLWFRSYSVTDNPPNTWRDFLAAARIEPFRGGSWS